MTPMPKNKIERVKLLVMHGNAEIGTIFVRGDLSHGVPDFSDYKNDKPEDWYWAENTKKEELEFLPASCFSEELKDNYEVL